MGYGFGRGPFGSGPFGRTHDGEAALDEAFDPAVRATSPDLHTAMSVMSDSLDRALGGVDAMPSLLSAWDVPIPQAKHTLTAITTTLGVETVYTFDAGDEAALLEMAPSRYARRFTDGWWARTSEGAWYPVVACDALTRTVTLGGRVSASATAELEFWPPQVVELLMSAIGRPVDPLDPTHYTRRMIQHQATLGSMATTHALFEKLGLIYGFDVSVRHLWCVPEERAQALLVTNPAQVWELPAGSGDWYTDIPADFIAFDVVPMDVVPLDSETDAIAATPALTWTRRDPDTGAVSTTSDWYTAETGALIDGVFPLRADGRPEAWLVLERSGVRLIIERVESGGRAWVTTDTTPIDGTWSLTFDSNMTDADGRPICDPGQIPASAYRIDITPGEILTEPGVDLDRMFQRMTEKIEEEIPLHIRLAHIVYVRPVALLSSVAGAPSVTAHLTASLMAPQVIGAQLDAIPLDDQPLDDGIHLLTVTRTVVGP